MKKIILIAALLTAIPVWPQAASNITNLQPATAAFTSMNIRLANAYVVGTVYVTFAGLTGSPSGCQLQFLNGDSLGNNITNGAPILINAVNGTNYYVTGLVGTGLQNAAQMAVTYTCTVYPTAGTVSIDFAPSGQRSISAPDCEFSFIFTAAGRAPSAAGFDNRVTACTNWTLIYQGDTVSTVSLEIDNANLVGGVAGSWTVWPAVNVALGNTLPLTTTTRGSVTVYGYYPFISVNLNSIGSGTITGRAIGWRAWSGSDSTSAASPSVGIDITGQVVLNCNQTFPVNFSAAATAQIVAPTAGFSVRVCGVYLTSGTAGGTLQWEYGTGANCAVGTTVLTAAYTVPSNSVINQVGAGTQYVFKTAPGTALCAVTTGTTAEAGWINVAVY